jgi:type VI secretion system protein ImpA
MASDSLLDFDELLAPIPGEEPAGPTSVYFAMRPQFEEMRREVTEEQAKETKEDIKNADWKGLERKSKEALAETSKDLRIAGYLLEALVKNHGFHGAREGLKLLKLLTAQCWDRLNPPVDPEDAEVRSGPFNWIDDPERGLRFPTTLRLTPLLIGRDRTYCYYDCRPQAPTEEAQALRLEAERAIESAPADQLTGVRDEIAGCLEEVRALMDDLSAKMGKDAPGISSIGTVLEECLTFLEQVLQKRPDATAKSDKEAEEGAPAAAGGGGGLSPGATRADIYHQLNQAALKLKELEPHSPIPYLLLRAVELGQMPFPKLMQELVRDANALTELKREFGIKDPPAPSD